MSELPRDPQQARAGGALQHIYRFAILLAGMTTGIGILVIIEAAVLWRLGIEYAPRMHIQSVSVCEFIVGESGRRGASRITYVRNGREHSVQHEILLHDMLAPEQAHRLEVPGDARQLAIATQAERIAVACFDGCVYTAASMHRAEPLQLLARVPSGDVNRLACSADGRFVAAADSHYLYLWQTAGRTLRHRWDLPPGPIAALAFTNNAQYVLACTVAGQAFLWDVTRGSICKSFQSRSDIHEAAFSSQADAVLLLSSDGGLWHYDLGASRDAVSRPKFKANRCPHGAAAFSRDGSTVAVVSHRGDFRYYIAIWDLKTCRQTRELQIGPGFIKGLQFAADGTLYGWDHHGMIQSWSAESKNGRRRFSILRWARNRLSPSGAAAFDATSASRRTVLKTPNGRSRPWNATV